MKNSFNFILRKIAEENNRNPNNIEISHRKKNKSVSNNLMKLDYKINSSINRDKKLNILLSEKGIRRSVFSKMKEKFREIYDDQDLYDNLRFDIKFTRVFIRYAVRVFGIRYSILILNCALSFVSFKKGFSYHAYLIRINIYRLKNFLYLLSEDYQESFRIKEKWAQYVIKHSPSKKAIGNADYYSKIVSADDSNPKEICENNLKKFYIYGPSAHNDPQEKYNEYTLIHLKPFPKELNFHNEILFSNSFYFTNAIKGNLKSCKKIFIKGIKKYM